MLKQGAFINKKFYKLFAASLLGAVATGINTILDSVISGNQLGENALTAVSIVSPLVYIVMFFSVLYAPGYSIMYGKYNGEFDKENAYRTAGQSMVTCAIIGTMLASMLAVFKESFLNYYGCTEELYTNASAYYSWIIILTLIFPFSVTLCYFLSVDADTLLTSIAGIASIIANIVLSSVLCRRFGVSGLGMGTCGSHIISIAIYGLHWLRKVNSIHFKLCFRMKEFREAVKMSTAVALSLLFIALTDIIMNKVILVSCGITMVTAYSIINLAYSIFEGFAASYTAAAGIVSTFTGEKNNAGVRNVIKTMVKTTVGLGLILSVILLFLAPRIPKLYGLESPEIIEAAVFAARWMAIAAVPYGIAYISITVYPFFGKVKLGIAMSLLNDFVCPLAMSIPLAFAFGFTGVSVGMALNAYLVLGAFTFFVVKKYGKKDFPLYLKDYGEEVVSFDLKVTEETIVEIRDAVKAELDKHGYEIENIELLIEELYKRIYEKNPGKSVMSECALLFGEDYVRIIVRDDGMIFNFVDENNKIESINAHTLNSLLERVQDKEYILTTSFNRNGFVFEK